jgi:hypothetical protein
MGRRHLNTKLVMPLHTLHTKVFAMKAAVYFAIATLSITSSIYAQGTCAAGGGHLGGIGPVSPYGNGVYNAADPFNFPSAIQPATAVGVRPAGPQARITVVDASSPLQTRSNVAKPTSPAARLTVVTDDDTPVNPAKKSSGTSKSTEPTNVESAPALDSNTSTINEALKGLVGTWKAVARRGDGELTTVELRLDDRGWAELTVPDADGKPSTIKRRAELNGDELKLTGPDAELLLGQLIDVNSRQMVLARASGQVTFVRP